MPWLLLGLLGVAALAFSGKGASGNPKPVYPDEAPDPETATLDVQEFQTLAAAEAALTSQGYVIIPNKAETTPQQKAFGAWIRAIAHRLITDYKGKIVVARLPEMGLLAWVRDDRGVGLYGAPP